MQTLIENVNIINPFEEIKTNQNVLIENNLIKEISSQKINANANIIDGDDNYLLSGLIAIPISLQRVFTNRKIWQILWGYIFTMRFPTLYRQ